MKSRTDAPMYHAKQWQCGDLSITHKRIMHHHGWRAEQLQFNEELSPRHLGLIALSQEMPSLTETAYQINPGSRFGSSEQDNAV